MEIEELQTLNAPNIFSLSEPIISIKIKLGAFADVATKDIENFNNRIMTLFPGLYKHKCAKGYIGGFIERLHEGTYLAHVTEHLSLELQCMLGHEVNYGKARQIKDDLYKVIYACHNPVIGKACGLFIIRLINSIIEKSPFDFEKEFQSLKTLYLRYDEGPSTRAIVSEAKKRGIPVSEIDDSGMLCFGYGKYQKHLCATLYEGTSSIAVDIACDKQLTKIMLDEISIPTPRGQVCLSYEEAVISAKEISYPVVVKPKSGNKGKFVFLEIYNENDLEHAFNQALNFDKEVIIEKFITGKDYRLLIVDGKFVAAAERIPAHVVGDGTHTIKELIDLTNRNVLRGEDHEKPLTKIKIDENLYKMIDKQDMNISLIPESGKIVRLRGTANLSTGGEAHDCTNLVHPKNIYLAESAAKTIGLHIAGIDMIIPDISKPIEKDYGAIVEVNAAPGIRMHLHPTYGQKRDVASSIIDMIYPDKTPFSIPIVSITGTNGKTTTTRMISNILRTSGFVTGYTTTHGIYINDICIEDGDTTGPRSARRILNDRNVEAAVLETARGGIVRKGLAYEKADVAVITNLSEDHLGIDSINTLEELFNVKSLVVEAVKDSGACILNADDPWVERFIEKSKGKIILYSLDNKNTILNNHMTNGGNAIFIWDDRICFSYDKFIHQIMKVDEIPAVMNGLLKHNIYNSLAAISAGCALGIPFEIIRKSMQTFSNDKNTNPGRFNIFDLGEFKVVLDYGHNIDGYKVTIEALKKLSPSRLIGIVGVPGDRRDEDIRKIGEISGKSFDSIIIKEDYNLRGRKPMEVANTILDGAIRAGMQREKIRVIPNERDAFIHALNDTQNGDVLAVFFEQMDTLVDIIENRQGNFRSIDKPNFCYLNSND
ncbi:MAG: cyanophycin synthetase [Ignavibacteriales bacterium]